MEVTASQQRFVPQVRGSHLRQRPEIHPSLLRGQGSCHGAQDRCPENGPGGSAPRSWAGGSGTGASGTACTAGTPRPALSTKESGGALAGPTQEIQPSMFGSGRLFPQLRAEEACAGAVPPHPVPSLPSSTSAVGPALWPPPATLCSCRSSTTTRATTACPPTSTLSTTPSCEPTCPRAKATQLPTVRTRQRSRAEAHQEQL